MWDTEENSGVLIYVLLAERRVEIVADRGINRRVEVSVWRDICAAMENAFRQGRYADGAVAGIESIGRLLSAHFPAGRDNPDELDNAPVRLWSFGAGHDAQRVHRGHQRPKILGTDKAATGALPCLALADAVALRVRGECASTHNSAW